MKYILESEFNKIYDELSECYLTEANVGQVDGFKVWFFRIINKYIEDLLSKKITIEEVIDTAFPEVSEEHKVRILNSYNLFISPKHNNLPVKSSWHNLTEFSSIADAIANLPAEWISTKGIYVIRQKSTNRLYIGKAFGFLAGPNNSLIERMHDHFMANKRDSTFHELVADHQKDFECAILKVLNDNDNVDIAEFNAIENYKTLYNLFDFNMKPGGEGGSVITKNYPEIVKEVVTLLKDNTLYMIDIAKRIKEKYYKDNTYDEKNVRMINKVYNIRSAEQNRQNTLDAAAEANRKSTELYKGNIFIGSFDSVKDAAQKVAELENLDSYKSIYSNFKKTRAAWGHYHIIKKVKED